MKGRRIDREISTTTIGHIWRVWCPLKCFKYRLYVSISKINFGDGTLYTAELGTVSINEGEYQA